MMLALEKGPDTAQRKVDLLIDRPCQRALDRVNNFMPQSNHDHDILDALQRFKEDLKEDIADINIGMESLRGTIKVSDQQHTDHYSAITEQLEAARRTVEALRATGTDHSRALSGKVELIEHRVKSIEENQTSVRTLRNQIWLAVASSLIGPVVVYFLLEVVRTLLHK